MSRTHSMPLPLATIRRRVTVPLRFSDGYAATACVHTFDGLVDGKEHIALGLGEDERDYSAAAQMLLALGAGRARLLSNNPDKAEQLGRLGVVITERIPTAVHLSKDNVRYLAAKAAHTAHTIVLPLAE